MSQTKLYVGNLSYKTTREDLEKFFSTYGSVTEVNVITDRETGRSKGFGFVTFEDKQAAKEAIEKTNGAEVSGRNIRVNMANEDRKEGGGGGRSSGRPSQPRGNGNWQRK